MATTYSNISANLSFRLNKGTWKFTVRGSYDFDKKQVAALRLQSTANLHC
jgi:hypothetical protein